MAHTKSSGSARQGEKAFSKRLGVKINHGAFASPGNIIVRQRGTPIRPGKNVKIGTDCTIYAAIPGTVKFTTKYRRSNYNNQRKIVKYANVEPMAAEEAKA